MKEKNFNEIINELNLIFIFFKDIKKLQIFEMSLQAIVDYGGILGGANKNFPSDCLPTKKIIITPLDGNSAQDGACGWYRWFEDENYKKEPTIYILEFRRKQRSDEDTPPEWRWSKYSDQSRAEELYEKYGKRPVE